MRRQKSDAADAGAICEAAQRPNMRFVPVKSEETQGAAAVFRVRELLIRRLTQKINALRGHLTEFGEIVPEGAASVRRLIALIEGFESDLDETAQATLQIQGARSTMPVVSREDTATGRWLRALLARAHPNVAVVALAGKMARIARALLHHRHNLEAAR